MAEIPHSMVIFLLKVRKSYRDLSSQVDPTRKKFNLMLYIFQLKWMFLLS